MNILFDNAKAGSGWWTDTAWDYCKKITFNADAYISSGLSNFPMLVHIENDGDLFGECQSGGDDILFTMDGDNETKLNHEIEYWNWDTGNSQVDAEIWVNVTSVSSSADTVIWMYYGNASASNQESLTGVWDSDYESVYHMVGAAYTDIDDSTSNSNDITHYTVGMTFNQPGKISDCVLFNDVSGSHLGASGVSLGSDSCWTASCWVRMSSLHGERRTILSEEADYALELSWRMDDTNDALKDNVFVSYVHGASTTAYAVTARDYASVDTWYYLTGKYDTSANLVYVYVDGVEKDTSAYENANSPIDGLVIGANRDPHTDREFEGEVDEVRISKIARSADWIKASYHTSNETASFLTIGTEQESSSGATVPVVTTDDATGVEETNATIRGTLTNNGSADTTCWFQYGDKTPPTDNNVSQGVIADGASFNYNWQSLTPGKHYYFDTQANNSEGWDTTGGIKSFLTKPNAPTGASCSAGEGWINVSWTGATGADRYLVRYKSGSSPTSVTDGTLFDNVTLDILYINKSIDAGTHYFSVWSYAYQKSPALHHYSDTYDTTSGTELAVPTWYSESFGGNVTVTEPAIDVELNESSWVAGSLDCGSDVQKNFTFYQNGTTTIDITIGINSTNGNYSFVNYTTWASNGHDQYCANFTVDTWSSESMIEPDYPASSILKNSFAPGNFAFGIRLWMPKSVTYQDRQEDFEVVLYVSEST